MELGERRRTETTGLCVYLVPDSFVLLHMLGTDVCVCVCVSHSHLQKLLYSEATSGRRGGPFHLNHVPSCHVRSY